VGERHLCWRTMVDTFGLFQSEGLAVHSPGRAASATPWVPDETDGSPKDCDTGPSGPRSVSALRADGCFPTVPRASSPSLLALGYALPVLRTEDARTGHASAIVRAARRGTDLHGVRSRARASRERQLPVSRSLPRNRGLTPTGSPRMANGACSATEVLVRRRRWRAYPNEMSLTRVAGFVTIGCRPDP
jgi:hypothetical protein